MQIQRWLALIGATLIISLNVYAQAPLYVLKINHNQGQLYEYQGSDSGVYNSSVSISGSGIATGHSEQQRFYTIYYKHPGGNQNPPSTLSVQMSVNGLIRSTVQGDNDLNEVRARTVFSHLPNNQDWSAYYGPYLYSAPVSTNWSLEIPVFRGTSYLLTASSYTVTLPDWPGVPYVPYQGTIDEVLFEETRGCSVATELGSCDGVMPQTYGFVTVNLAVFGGNNLPYSKQPGDNRGDSTPLQCGSDNDSSNGTFSASLNHTTGNVMISANNEVKARGLGLSNKITINSQVVEESRPMGNATFTYDMHVYSPAMSGQTQWLIVDGDGQRLNYGSGATPVSGAGNFATFSTTASGYRVSSAGAPERLRDSGNYAYDFDTSGNLLSITDPKNNVQNISYNNGKIYQVTDASSNKVTTFNWTGNRITSVVENGNALTTLGYDANGRMTSLVLSDGTYGTAKSLTFTYDASTGRLTSYTRDNEIASVYNISYIWINNTPLASVYGRRSTIGAIYGLISQVPGAALRHVIINQKGGTVTYDMDSSWNIIRETHTTLNGATAPTSYAYGWDTNRNLVSWSDGATTKTYEYETNGKLKKENRQAGAYTQYTWSGANLTGVSDSIGTIMSLSYGNSQQPNVPTTITDGLGNMWTLGYNSHGQITTVTPPTGAVSGVTTYSYDENSSSSYYGWLRGVTDALGNERRNDSFNAAGDITQYSTDPDPSSPSTRNNYQTTYDGAHRVRSVTQPDNKTAIYQYSGRNLQYIDDEAQIRTNYTFCPACEALQSVSKPLGYALNYERDTDYDLSKFIDARSNITEYLYGLSRELKRIKYPDTTEVNYAYDNSSRLTKVTNSRLQDAVTTYDTTGRVQQLSFPTTSETTQTFNYRADDSILSFSDEAGTTTYEYYGNRLVKAVIYNYSNIGLLNQQRVEYEYWPDNLLKKITWKNANTVVGTWVYAYDAAGRMTSVTSFNQTNTFSYDGEGKVLTQNNHNNTSISYAWNDARGWPTSITHKQGSTSFDSYTLEYDNLLNTVGNITKVTDAGGTVTYGYDTLYRLTSEARTGTNAYSKSYQYDLAGNLTTLNGAGFASYDAANNIATLSGGTLTHDADGNVTSVTGAGMPATTINWNSRSKITSLSSGSTTVSFKTDALGHRVMQQQGTVKRFFIFAGDNLLGEVESNQAKVAYTWGSDGLVSERLFGVYILLDATLAPEELAVVESIPQSQDETGVSGYATEMLSPPDIIPIPVGNITLWYHYGAEGETRYLTDEQGAIADSYRYDAYGNPVFATNVYYNPHRYGGKYGYHSNLNPAGSVLAGARWYSPNLRRWMSRDPIGYDGGDNLFEYVDSSPVRFVDPEGMDAVENVVDFAVGIGNNSDFGLGIVASGWRMLLSGIIWGDWDEHVVDDTASYRLGAIVGVANSCALGNILSPEISIGSNLRIAPFGANKGRWYSRLPHYHRAKLNKYNKVINGQGMSRHRPFQAKSTDTNFFQRF